MQRVGKPAFHVRINSLGYRGPEIPREKPPGEYRVVMIGDSFTFGDYVDDHETLPAKLEEALRADCAAVRAINAGVMNTTIDSHAQMAERALALEPDLVVLTFYENDVDDLRNPMWRRSSRAIARRSRDFRCRCSTPCSGTPLSGIWRLPSAREGT
ncbi:MAG: hypothetical protein IPJ78_03495 [Gemmatimonadetes bacterium]|nr:hypothetical protein [Gemmatimonadota bacterium]